MRLLVAYGLDPLTGSVDNMPCKNEMVKESAKILLKEMVDFSSEIVDSQPVKSASLRSKLPAQGQTDVSDAIFRNFARNIKCLTCDHFCLEKLKRQREGEGEGNVPQKKGDWICERCTFLNLAKNTRCFQCKENPSKRELVGGEWQCESCNYINFRKNMVCLKCDHKLPKTKAYPTKSSEPASCKY